MAHEYIGVNGVSRKINTKYIGVNGVSRVIKNEYIGVTGVARLCFSGINYSIPTSLTWSYSKGGSPSTSSSGFTVTTSKARKSDDTAVSSSFTVGAGTVITVTGTLSGTPSNPSSHPSSVPGTTSGTPTISYSIQLIDEEDGSRTAIADGSKQVSGNQGTIPPQGSITISKSGTYHLVVSGVTTTVTVHWYSDSSGVHSSGATNGSYMSEGTYTFNFS